MRRIPGLSPIRQERLRERLVERAVTGDATPAEIADGLIDALADALMEELPRDAHDVPGLTAKLLRFSDGLRADGRPGMARDLDRLAGVLRSIAAGPCPPTLDAVPAA